jgi:hypothetical protein
MVSGKMVCVRYSAFPVSGFLSGGFLWLPRNLRVRRMCMRGLYLSSSDQRLDGIDAPGGSL